MEEPVVTTKQGRLKGKTGTDYVGQTYYSFQGIPYAKPPVGPLRFKVCIHIYFVNIRLCFFLGTTTS